MKTGTKLKLSTLKEQRENAELGLIIDEMGRAMWNADRQYIASKRTDLSLTSNMRLALWKFQEFCMEHYGKKA